MELGTSMGKWKYPQESVVPSWLPLDPSLKNSSEWRWNVGEYLESTRMERNRFPGLLPFSLSPALSRSRAGP